MIPVTTLQELNIEKPNVLPSEFLRIGWIKDILAIAENKEDISPNSNEAVGWCILGSFCAALDIESEYPRMYDKYDDFMASLRHEELLSYLGFIDKDEKIETFGPTISIVTFNDEAKDVLEILEIVESIELHLGWR